MTSYYDYANNISVATTPNGDKVISMNKQIFVEILNHLFDAGRSQEERGLKATAEDTYKLWEELKKKGE